VLQTYGKSDVTYDWYAGNSGVVGRSGKFIAAHAADIARHRAGARDRDDELSHARYNFDWNKQFELSLDPERAKQYHDETLPEEIFKKAEFCSMCGPKHCPMNSKISDESLDQLKDKLEECNTSV